MNVFRKRGIPQAALRLFGCVYNVLHGEVCIKIDTWRGVMGNEGRQAVKITA